MSELLRHYARFRDRNVWLSIALYATPLKWRKELSEESLIVAFKSVLGNWRRVFSGEIFLETGGLQSRGYITCERREG